MRDLFQAMGVTAPLLRDPGARPPPPPRDRSFLFPPEVQAASDVLGSARCGGWPLVERRLVGQALAQSKIPELGPKGGDEPFRLKCEAVEAALSAGLLWDRGLTVVEDRSGRILDGLVLLKAVAATGIPIHCHWVSGVDPGAIAVMDRHKTRPGPVMAAEEREQDRGRDRYTAGIVAAAAAVAAAGLGGICHVAAYERARHRSGHAWIMLDKPMADAGLAAMEAAGVVPRPLLRHEELYRDVEAGRFVATGQPLVIGWDAVPLDGGRRMRAVSLTGRPIPTLVVYGIDPRTPREVFDCTPAQNLGGHLQRIGHPEGWDIQSSTKVLKRVMEGVARPTQSELYAMYRAWTGYDVLVRQSKFHQDHICQSVHVAVRAMISLKRSPEAADAFLSKILAKTRDPDGVAAFRAASLAEMSEREAAAAKVVWDRIGARITSVPNRDLNGIVTLFLTAFLRASGERVSSRKVPGGAERYPTLDRGAAQR